MRFGALLHAITRFFFDMPRLTTLARRAALFAFAVALFAAPSTHAQAPDTITLDNFDGYLADSIPTAWKRLEGRTAVPITPAYSKEREFHLVRREGSQQYLEGYTRGEVHTLILPNETTYVWDLGVHPKLRWRWRALALPEGANERDDRTNDAGTSLYVTFDADWLGRPRSIKYTYSSSLPAGTVLDDHKRLKTIVVASRADGLNRWKTIERNVAADFRALFGEEPPARPASITLRSDTDTTGGEARVHTDDIQIAQ
jgi:hypothetical protein